MKDITHDLSRVKAVPAKPGQALPAAHSESSHQKHGHQHHRSQAHGSPAGDEQPGQAEGPLAAHSESSHQTEGLGLWNGHRILKVTTWTRPHDVEQPGIAPNLPAAHSEGPHQQYGHQHRSQAHPCHGVEQPGPVAAYPANSQTSPRVQEEQGAQGFHHPNPDLVRRLEALEGRFRWGIPGFDGLMKHLKRNTEKQDFEKQVLASPLEVLVPEEFDEVLRETFARHCSYGERLNTELMHSSKWIKMLGYGTDWLVVTMLKELDLMPAVATSPKRPCLASWADADLIFQRVLHDVDYGGKRLTYEDFCKALCLVAVNVHPDLSDWEAAMQELLTRIASVAERVRPSQADALEDDFSLDPNVLLVLEHFKPKLHDLFRSFARRQLPNPADAPVGTGTTRLKERSVWRTQVTQQREIFPFLILTKDTFASKASTMAQTSTGEQISEQSTELPHQVDGSPRRGKPMTPKASSVKLPAEALKAVAEKGIENVAESLLGSSELTAWAESLGDLGDGWRWSATGSRAGQWSPVSTDPYCYASGSPTMKNRQSFLSLEQLFSLCKELKIMPEARDQGRHLCFKMAEDEYVTATQETIGTLITKPKMTEKYLKKPPFRFLHDIVMEVTKKTTFGQGLFSPEECDAANLSDTRRKKREEEKKRQEAEAAAAAAAAEEPAAPQAPPPPDEEEERKKEEKRRKDEERRRRKEEEKRRQEEEEQRRAEEAAAEEQRRAEEAAAAEAAPGTAEEFQETVGWVGGRWLCILHRQEAPPVPPGTMSEGPYSTTDEIAQRAQDALAQRAQDTGRPRTAGRKPPKVTSKVTTTEQSTAPSNVAAPVVIAEGTQGDDDQEDMFETGGEFDDGKGIKMKLRRKKDTGSSLAEVDPVKLGENIQRLVRFAGCRKPPEPNCYDIG
eukprot:g27993.t1